MKCLGLHNKPTAEVHPGHMLTGPKEEEEEEEEDEKEEEEEEDEEEEEEEDNKLVRICEALRLNTFHLTEPADRVKITVAYPTQQSSSSSRGIPCSHKRRNDDRVTEVQLFHQEWRKCHP
jgi:hypothetical protein